MVRWTGPAEWEIDSRYHWIAPLPIPPERWPYGPPSAHEACCLLHHGGRFCDCAASDASDGVQ